MSMEEGLYPLTIVCMVPGWDSKNKIIIGPTTSEVSDVDRARLQQMFKKCPRVECHQYTKVVETWNGAQIETPVSLSSAIDKQKAIHMHHYRKWKEEEMARVLVAEMKKLDEKRKKLEREIDRRERWIADMNDHIRSIELDIMKTEDSIAKYTRDFMSHETYWGAS